MTYCGVAVHVRLSNMPLKAQVTDSERENIRQQIAGAATKLLQAPESHAASLRYLVGLTSSGDDKVCL